jgi:undecaprenyl diphosphate synthase
VRSIVEAAPEHGVGTLTLYAFSSDNWQRPEAEVHTLMGLFRRYLRSETAQLVKNGVRLRCIGRRDRLDRSLLDMIQASEAATQAGTRLRLRLAIDYSSRDVLVAAARLGLSAASLDRERLTHFIGEAMNDTEPAGDVDLLIRTGGEQRLSDFLLWECAYAEMVFSPRLWPDFGPSDLAAAIADFQGRERRFGRVVAAAG